MVVGLSTGGGFYLGRSSSSAHSRADRYGKKTKGLGSSSAREPGGPIVEKGIYE
jgi:hypothetical protein